MKKKTRFKLRNDLVVPFWIAVSICLIGAAVNSLLFQRSFFRALSKLDEEPIATITFKKKTAQRKFMDRVVWDMLRQNSPVYNGDTIHTAEQSEATVWFPDGTVIELADNTMAQVFLHDDGSLAADLESGALTVDASEESAGLVVSSGGTQVNIASGSSLFAQNDGDAVNVNVISGNATMEDGSVVQRGAAFVIDPQGRVLPALAMQQPSPAAKILYHTEEAYPMQFTWNDVGTADDLVLTVSTDKEYKNVVFQQEVTGITSQTVNLNKGIYYWNLTRGGDASVQNRCEGKLQLVQALKPELVAPAADYQYSYRSKNPAVRFIWSESETATAYHLVVSRNQNLSNPVVEQRSSSVSAIISTLEQGTYYWQVTPYYTTNRIGLTNPSEVGSFRIVKSGALSAPVLTVPATGAFVDKSSAKGATFSWRAEAEAARYRITISSRENLNAPIVQRETSENYITIPAASTASFGDGQYYWAVTQIDAEGNESPRSDVRSFYALTGKVEQRTVFPPEGYQVWSPLLADMRFTWKTNVQLTHKIQIARDNQFANIVYEADESSTSHGGVSLSPGTYWWRITANEGTFASATTGKQFVVVSELPAPAIIEPDESHRAVVRPQKPYTFRWKEVEGADYYRVRVYDPTGEDPEAPVIDENFITDTELSVNLSSLPEKTYRWEIQAFVYETSTASRRNSLRGDATFALRKLRPVSLYAPVNGITIPGDEALEEPPLLQWSSVESLAKSSLQLVKIDEDGERTTRIDSASGENAKERIEGYQWQLEALSAGLYEWTIVAETYDGLDVSATDPFNFTITPIPPFTAPANPRTEGGTNFNADYFRKTPYIVFRWSSVRKANDYVIDIYQRRKKKPVLTLYVRGNATTSYKLDDLALLEKLKKGDYEWTVRAVNLNEAGNDILRDGTPARASFTIDYDVRRGSGNTRSLYGQ
ncbi:MAG: FecR domain-containing protein [Treponema sp.]|nr:FecR domain-containing protein [Treponema sp.]